MKDHYLSWLLGPKSFIIKYPGPLGSNILLALIPLSTIKQIQTTFFVKEPPSQSQAQRKGSTFAQKETFLFACCCGFHIRMARLSSQHLPKKMYPASNQHFMLYLKSVVNNKVNMYKYTHIIFWVYEKKNIYIYICTGCVLLLKALGTLSCRQPSSTLHTFDLRA